MRLVVASNNVHKRSEIARILGGCGIEVELADDTIFVVADESGITFAENARKKSEAFASANNLPALADDSGLCVDALRGEPGVRSARYAGDHASDADNNAKLLAALSGETNRSARFICCVHLGFPDGRPPITAEGRVEGRILEEANGAGGFGYDPLFFCPELGKSFGLASPEEKASVSHRGRALRALALKLKTLAQAPSAPHETE